MTPLNTSPTEIVFVDCSSCADSTLPEDVRVDDNGDNFCEDCYYEVYEQCGTCGDEMSSEDSHNIGDDVLCEGCFYDYNTYCNDCGDATSLDYTNDDGVCDDCDEDNRREYHDWNVYDTNTIEYGHSFLSPDRDCYNLKDGQMVSPHGIPSHDRLDSFSLIPSRRYQGVEIEVNDKGNYDRDSMRDIVNADIQDTRGGNVRPSVDVVYDGSVTGGEHEYGFEYVLHPRRGDLLVHDLKVVSKSVSQHGGYISSKCGYHLHIDTRDYDWYHFAVLTLMTKMIEPHIYSWIAPSRQSSRWCKPISQSLASFSDIYDRDSFMEFYYDECRYSHDKYNDKRYHGLNLHSHFQANQGTELRYHSGTLNPDKMVHWSIFWGNVIDRCKVIADELYESGDIRNGLRNSKFYQSLVNPYPDTILSKESIDEIYTSLVSASDRKDWSNESYNRMSDSMVTILTNGDHNEFDGTPRVESILALLKGSRQYGLPVISYRSMCQVFDIPDKTMLFYRQRAMQFSNDENSVAGFEKVTSFATFDTNTNTFNHIDWLLHRLQKVSNGDISRNAYFDNYSRLRINPRQILRYIG